MPKELRFSDKDTSVDRALELARTGKATLFRRFFKSSSAEDLIYFLQVSGRSEVVAKIHNIMSVWRDSPQDFADHQVVKFEKNRAFLHTIIRTSNEVFQLPRIEVAKSPELYVQSVKLARQYKKLISRVFNDLGFVSPDYILFSEADDVDLESDSEIIHQLHNEVHSHSRAVFISPYLYDGAVVNATDDWSFYLPREYDSSIRPETDIQSTAKKSKARRVKTYISKLLLIVSSIIGVGEAFAPAKFYLVMLLGAGFALPISYALAGFAFVAAFSVNTLLFHGDSYNTFKNVFLKNRLFKDAQGYSLEWYEIARNLFAVAMSFFSALVLAGMSFYFSGFGVILAGIVSVMTFIGFFGVLSYAATNIWNLQTIAKLFNYVIGLILQPLVGLFKSRTLLSAIKNILTLVVNVTALTAMAVAGVGVVAATSGMFFATLMSIPLLASFGPLVVGIVVAIAELALGTFFVRNAGKFIDAVRDTLVNGFGSKKDANVAPHPLRKQRVIAGIVAGAILISFAFINAGGYAVGYLGAVMSHSLVITALSLGGLVTPAIGVLIVAAPVIAALSYLFTSVGGNAFAALRVVTAPPTFSAFDRATYIAQDLATEASRAQSLGRPAGFEWRSPGLRDYPMASPRGERAKQEYSIAGLESISPVPQDPIASSRGYKGAP